MTASARDRLGRAEAASTLDAVELVRVRLPLRHPLESGHGRESERDVVLVRAIGVDGVEGWGECSALSEPTYTPEHTAGAWAALRDELVPTAWAGRFDGAVRHPMAYTALEVALIDLALRRDGRPAAVLRADGTAGPVLAWTAVIGVQPSIDDLLAAVADGRAHLAQAFKLKIRPGWDLDPIAAVRDAIPGTSVSVDANGSYSRDDADHLGAIAAQLAGAPGAYIEQPLAADDLSGLGALAPRLAVPIALDESLGGPADLAAASSAGALGLVNLKPARVGGVAASVELEAAVLALEAGRRPEVYLGGMLETGVGRSAALSIARALDLDIRHTDLGPSDYYFDDDLTEPLVLAFDALHWPSDEPGLARHPRPSRLAEVAVDRITLRP